MRRIGIHLFLLGGFFLFSCGREPVPVLSVVDTENGRVIYLTGEKTRPVNFYDADFVVLGGGLGGIAAALSICLSGRTAVLVEETDRIAGCFAWHDTTLFNEHRFVETSGSSISYQTFRSKIREWYDGKSRKPPWIPPGFSGDSSDFGGVRLCFETEAALDVIDEMLKESVERGRLTIVKRNKVARVVTFGDRVASMLSIDMDGMTANQLTGWMFIDATRTGYVLPLFDIEYFGDENRVPASGKEGAGASGGPDSAGRFMYCRKFSPPEKSRGTGECVVLELVPDVPDDGGEYVRIPVSEPHLHIRALKRIEERDISAEFGHGPRARFFRDAVCVGYHPGRGGSGRPLTGTLPFQIPLGAMVPVRYTNFLAGGGILDVDESVAGVFQEPAIEWMTGEAAGEAAAYCAGHGVDAHELAGNPAHVRGLQEWLVTRRGIPIYWYDDVRPQDPDFAEAQLKPFDESKFRESLKTLKYRD